MQELAKELVHIGKSEGLAEVGFADAQADFLDVRSALKSNAKKGYSAGMEFTYRNPKRSTSPKMTLPSAKTLIVGAYSYFETSIQGHPGDFTDGDSIQIARYAQRDYYSNLRQALAKIAECLKTRGYKAIPIADDNALVDRGAAYRAGLGWYGKNGNLLLDKAGSWFVLGSVLTNAELPLGENFKPQSQGCGGCTRCISACPTGAIVENGVIDSRRCLAWLLQKPGIFPREFRKALHNRLYGCDDCQTVCPFNRKTEVQLGHLGPKNITVHEILNSSDNELLERFGHFYISKREPRYIRRNALIILGNISKPGDQRAVALLNEYLQNPDPILRAHAVWAAKNLEHYEMLKDLKDESDPMVLEELRLAV